MKSCMKSSLKSDFTYKCSQTSKLYLITWIKTYRPGLNLNIVIFYNNIPRIRTKCYAYTSLIEVKINVSEFGKKNHLPESVK